MLTYPEIDPVIFSIFGLKIRWYGMMYVLGFLGGWWLARRRSRQPWWQLNEQQVDDLVFYVMLGVILGGRIGYTLFYGWQTILADPLYLVRIWEGGMSFHGGLAGVLIAMWLYGRKLGRTMWFMTDFVAPFVPLGLGLGRIGNFINGELWGHPAPDVPWAMQVPCDGTPARVELCQQKLGLAPDVAMTPPLHPSMLYEAVLEGLVLFLILWVFSSKQRPYMAISGMFLLFYGLFRFVVEFYRVPDAHLGYLFADWVTMGQVLSAPMIIAGAVLLYFAYRYEDTTEAKA
jgi:phosphatidylglycerol:prolipoprotein diacylglycerol transferase